jgi:F-type H+-transporting ATPase subunit b
MLIDWFTVIAQVINFLILAWLLKRFLYRPILNAIDAREKRIASALANADKKSIEAEQQRNEFVHKNAVFDAQQTTRTNQLSAKVKTERTRLFDEVRQQSDHLRVKLQLALKNEQLILQDALSQRAREEVFNITRKVLNDLAEVNLEEQIVLVFIQRFETISAEEKAAFKLVFQPLMPANKTPLVVRTGFTLTDEQRALIESTIKHTLGYHDNEAIAFAFVIDSTVVSGIEISANGQKVAWNISDYLTSLAKGVEQILQSLVHVESKVESNNEGNSLGNILDNSQINDKAKSQNETTGITDATPSNQTEKGCDEIRG